MGRLLTSKQLAREINVSPGTVGWWVSKKMIPHIRLGPRLPMFDMDQIQEWLKSKIVLPECVK